MFEPLSAEKRKILPDTFAQGDCLVYSADQKNWYIRRIGIAKYLKKIQGNNLDAAIKMAASKMPDAEAAFVLAAAYAKQGQIPKAMTFVKLSLAYGLPFERFLAGPENLLCPLVSSPPFRTFRERYDKPLIHGPMVGSVTENSARFWVRTNGIKTVRVLLCRHDNFFDKIISSPLIQSDPTEEYTAILDVTGLKPSTHYFYKLEIDHAIQPRTYSFKTFPPANQNAEFEIIFGGCACYIPWHNYMWSTIKKHKPAALLLLGDNVYIDYPKNTEIQQYCYYRRQSEYHFRNLISGVPVYAIWDDHDFANNNSFGTPRPNKPPWKKEVLRTFKNQWVNPAYGTGNTPGVFFKFTIAHVDFFMLDCRYYRKPSFTNRSQKATGKISMLGERQKQWLKQGLKNSKASFKAIVSSVPWSDKAKAPQMGRFDTWRGYPGEREEIFDFIKDNHIKGVFLLSADRHRSEAWKLSHPGNYTFYEFESSRLTNAHFHKLIPSALFGYNAKCSFGKLIFKNDGGRPYVEYRIYSIDNEKIWSIRVYLDQLKN